MIKMMCRNNHARSSGFSLIELMVAVAIVGILAAVVYPSYREHVRRGARADVKAVLMDNVAFVERFASENNGLYRSAAGVAPVLPNLVSPRGATGTNVKYNLAFAAGEPTNRTFQIIATPANSMTGDDCGSFVINNVGQRESRNTLNSKDMESCWNR